MIPVKFKVPENDKGRTHEVRCGQVSIIYLEEREGISTQGHSHPLALSNDSHIEQAGDLEIHLSVLTAMHSEVEEKYSQASL